MAHSRAPRPTLQLLLLTVTIALTGCGTSAYEDRFKARLEHLQRETPFQPVWEQPVEDFPAKSLSLRIPKIFRADESYALNPLSTVTPDPRRPDDIVDPYRVQPSFLKLPGHQRTYEGFTQVRSAQSLDLVVKPYYLYVAKYDKKDGKFPSGNEMERQLREALVKQFGKKSVTDWEILDPPPPTPEGSTITWKRIKATGEQYWVFYEDKVARYKIFPNTPGVYELYLYSTPDYHVMLGWRYGKDVGEALGLEAIAPICAGTMKVK